MPPRTDCSAGMSWGGFRLPSDPRVPSIGSRCVTDKAAVLHCVPRRNVSPAVVKRSSCWGAGAVDIRDPPNRSGLPAGTDNCCPAALSGPRALCTESYPQYPQVIHRSARRGGIQGSAVVVRVLRRSVFAPQKQVSRYASPPLPTGKAHCPHGLWITCALSGIACAQPVGDPVETKKLCTSYMPLTCGNSASSVWRKYSFAKPSSTACRPALLIADRIPGPIVADSSLDRDQFHSKCAELTPQPADCMRVAEYAVDNSDLA